jgi:glutathione S-transferase
MSLVLYELGGNGGRRYSQFSWRTRLALAHKEIETETRLVRISDKAAIAFSGQDKVPILVDGDTVVTDSWRIAEYLETRYPGRPSLFGCDVGRGLARFVNAWVDRHVVPGIVPLLMIDAIDGVDADDALHLRQTMEMAFRGSLEKLAENRDTDIVGFRRRLDPARATLRTQPFLSGGQPAYADYILLSVFQWARIVSAFDPLDGRDVVAIWRERMLDVHDGLARSEAARDSKAAEKVAGE